MKKRFLYRLLAAISVGCAGLLGALSWGCRSSRGKITLDQILYHTHGSAVGSMDSGTWWNLVKDFSLPIGLFLLWYLFFLYLLFEGRLFQSAKENRGTAGKKISAFFSWYARHRRWGLRCFALLAVFHFFYASWNHQFFALIWNHCFQTRLIDKYYVAPDPVLLTKMPKRKILGIIPARRRNLVLCICESMEQTFDREALFGENLISEMTALQGKRRKIDGMRQVSGTHFTVASLAGIMYGLPLLADQTVWGEKSETELFFPKQKTLIDVLQANGYRVGFVQGGHLGFGGKEKLFRTLRPEDRISLETELERRGGGEISPKERNNWGMYDRWTFEQAKKKILEFQENEKKTKQPFALILLTVDPHEGNALDPEQKDVYGDARDIVRGQSRQLAEFAAWIRKQSCASRTMVVMTGDHFMMRDRLGEASLSALEDRRLFTYVWNGVSSLPKTKEPRVAATFDWPPTILEGMGFTWNSHRFGLGTSLYSKQKTLLETEGVDTWSVETLRRSPLYDTLSGLEDDENP